LLPFRNGVAAESAHFSKSGGLEPVPDKERLTEKERLTISRVLQIVVPIAGVTVALVSLSLKILPACSPSLEYRLGQMLRLTLGKSFLASRWCFWLYSCSSDLPPCSFTTVRADSRNPSDWPEPQIVTHGSRMRFCRIGVSGRKAGPDSSGKMESPKETLAR
jgi:hypothetical protein